MPEIDYQQLFEHYLFESGHAQKPIADVEAEAIQAGLDTGYCLKGQPSQTTRKIYPGDIYCYIGADCCLEYLVLEQNKDTWLALKISGWTAFADQYDLIIRHEGESKMIQLRVAAFVLPTKIEQSLYGGNAGGDILKRIKTTLLEKDRVEEDYSGAELPLKWRFFQQRFHSIEADLMQQHLHHDWKNRPIPVPLPLSASFTKQHSSDTSYLTVMRSWTSGLASLDKHFLNQLINPIALPAMIVGLIAPMPLLGNALIKKVSEKVQESLAGRDPEAPKQALDMVKNLGMSLLYSSPWVLIWAALKVAFREDFSYQKEPSEEIILKINPKMIGKEAVIKIKGTVVFSGVLKPVFSLGRDITVSNIELAKLTEIYIQNS